MKTLVDCIGKKYGYLLVLRKLIGGEIEGRKNILCLCDCGREVKIKSHDIKTGKIKSCGCGIIYNNKILICGYCKKEFVPSSGKSLYCSPKCRVNRWKTDNIDKVISAQLIQNEKRKGTIRPYNAEKRKQWRENKIKDIDYKNKINDSSRNRRVKIQNYLRNYKLTSGCCVCGYNSHHAALEFDHVRGIKSFNVCNAKSIKSAIAEIIKCDVVCSNCHKIRTYDRLDIKYDY